MLLILFILTLLISALLIYLIWYKAKLRERKLKEEILTHKYRNLKNRIDPLFLFNTLYTIPEMHAIDKDKTDIYVLKLIEIYRFILQYDDVNLIVMEKELEFVREYFKKEKERGKDTTTSES